MKWRPLARVARFLGTALLVAELLYVVVANAVIFSGVIQREASKPAENVNLAWDRAYSPWPGRAYVWGLRMRVQDGVQQFRLTVAYAKVDVVFWTLLHNEFRASYVQARGVTYRQVVRLEGTPDQERRLAAFPTLEGFSRPALLSTIVSPPPTAEELATLWSAQLDAVDATFDELWFLEYRYQGPGHIQGKFAFSPMRSLWIGPAQVQFDGGKISAGGHLVAPSFTGHLVLALAPVDLTTALKLQIFHTLDATIDFDTALQDLGVADLYVDGLGVEGPGRLTAALEVVGGRLTPRSALALWLPATEVRRAGYAFTGEGQLEVSVSQEQQQPTANLTLKGRLRVPFEKEPLEVALSDASAELVLMDNDLSRDVSLRWIHATVGEARIEDAKAITHTVGAVVPIVARMVLGDGPLVASATAHVTPEYTLVRLERAKLGGAELRGAAVAGANGWNGAAAGSFGGVPLGLRLHDGRLSAAPFASGSWLSEELEKVGIKPEMARLQ